MNFNILRMDCDADEKQLNIFSDEEFQEEISFRVHYLEKREFNNVLPDSPRINN